MPNAPTKVRSRTKKTGGRGTITTSHQLKGRDDISETRDFEDEIDCPNPAYVSVNQGMTKNLGDYNSVKIAVHVSLPSLPYDDDIKRTYQRASNLVNEFLDEEYTKAIEAATEED